MYVRPTGVLGEQVRARDQFRFVEGVHRPISGPTTRGERRLIDRIDLARAADRSRVGTPVGGNLGRAEDVLDRPEMVVVVDRDATDGRSGVPESVDRVGSSVRDAVADSRSDALLQETERDGAEIGAGVHSCSVSTDRVTVPARSHQARQVGRVRSRDRFEHGRGVGSAGSQRPHVIERIGVLDHSGQGDESVRRFESDDATKGSGYPD